MIFPERDLTRLKPEQIRQHGTKKRSNPMERLALSVNKSNLLRLKEELPLPEKAWSSWTKRKKP